MKNVLFLDFDGPLIPRKALMLPQNQPNFANKFPHLNLARKLELHPFIEYWKMDDIAISMLNNIAKRNCGFVLSTSWISLHEFKTLENLLRVNGFKGEFLPDSTLNVTFCSDDQSTRLNRAQSIAEWLSRHPEYNDKYIILDDLISAPEMAKNDLMKMYGLSPSRIFLADIDNGISLRTYEEILTKL